MKGPLRKTVAISLSILVALLTAIFPTYAESAPGANAASTDWNQLDAETLGYFQSCLRFDTSNPPDDTADAIAFLKGILDKRPDPSPTSPMTGEAWKAMKHVVADDFVDAIIAPNMTTGGTDSRFLRAKGVPAYGFVPGILSQTQVTRIHGGIDERRSVDSLNRGIRANYDLTIRLCAAR